MDTDPPFLRYCSSQDPRNSAVRHPAELVFALEQSIFRDRDGERMQLQVQFWQATLAGEGSGDPIRFHRYVYLTGRKLALLNGESPRDQDMRAVFIKGLPDDIFMDFKTALHNNPAGTKTLSDVFEILQVYAGSEAVKQKVASLMRQCARSFDKRPPAGVFVAHPDSATTRPWFDFAKGKCTRGSQCKFAHSNATRADAPPPPVVCSHCSKRGHTVATCYAKYPEKRVTSARARPATKSSRPDSRSRATFLLGVRKDIDALLLEGEQDEEVGAVFSFTATPAIVPIASSPIAVNQQLVTLPPVRQIESAAVFRGRSLSDVWICDEMTYSQQRSLYAYWALRRVASELPFVLRGVTRIVCAPSYPSESVSDMILQYHGPVVERLCRREDSNSAPPEIAVLEPPVAQTRSAEVRCTVAAAGLLGNVSENFAVVDKIEFNSPLPSSEFKSPMNHQIGSSCGNLARYKIRARSISPPGRRCAYSRSESGKLARRRVRHERQVRLYSVH